MKILVLDPGNSTGWMFYDEGTKELHGGTIGERLDDIYFLFDMFKPDRIIYETFALYPGKAQAMSWNTFYPCEVIGVIKLWAVRNLVVCTDQGAACKKYSGGLDDRWITFKQRVYPNTGWFKITEHTKDAYMHLRYFLRNNTIYT